MTTVMPGSPVAVSPMNATARLLVWNRRIYWTERRKHVFEPAGFGKNISIVIGSAWKGKK